MISIRDLFCAVGLSAFAVGTLTAASPVVLGWVTTLFLIALVIATAVSVLATGSRQRFWIIFVATCWTCLVFEYGIMQSARFQYAGEFAGDSSPVPRLVPSDWLLGKFLEIVPQKEVGVIDPWGNGNEYAITSPDAWSFFHIGRFHFAWILGLLTAQTAIVTNRVLERRRQGQKAK